MTADRIAGLDRETQPRPETPVNRDFAPVAYYFDVALWSSRFSHGYRDLFRAMAGVDFRWLAGTLGAVLLVLVARRRRPQTAAACCTAAMGFTLIGLEMLLLLAFQAMYGYVYQQLAIIIAAFMAGMAVGSGLALRAPAKRGMRTLVLLQVGAAIAPLLLCAVFAAVTPVLFPVLALLCGMLGGYEFPVASRIFSGRSTGTLYALDVAGSCVGAMLFSVYLIPVFGFLRTAVLAAIVSLAPAVMAMRSVSEPDPRG
jgi:spermidine synthase